VRITGRLVIDVARGDTVAAAELVATHAARMPAGDAAHVIVATDQQLRQGPAAVRAGEPPGAGAAQRAMGSERRPPPAAGDEVPVHALDEHLELDELERVDRRANFVAPLLLGSPAPVFRLDGATSLRAHRLPGGLSRLLEQLAVVAVQPGQLGGQGLLGDKPVTRELRRELGLDVAEHERNELRQRPGRQRTDPSGVPVR
jgi:hypothetical protein